MSVKDMIKKSVLESGVFDQYNISSILVALAAALALGILIFLVYRRFYTGVIYSRTFAVTLVGMTVLTCMVTLAISTNVVISLGMVGALSIVRFRTAVKDPMDLLYLFWAITTGITAGAGMYVLALLAAAIMTDETILIENLPDVRDINVLLEASAGIGAKVERIDRSTVKINGSTINDISVDYEYIKKIRASYYLLGALLGKYKHAEVPLPGGCNIGSRPIDQHLKGFRALGASVNILHGAIVAETENVVSVGATINIMMAASMASGRTIIENAAREPHVVDVANFLNSMGANIKGAGTDVIRIKGVEKLHRTEYSIIPDQIEAGTFMFAAAATGGDVTVKNVIPKHLEATTAKLEEIGCEVEEFDDAVRVRAGKRLHRTHVKTLPYPGYPTDMQPQIAVTLALAEGTSIVTESIFENRFKYADELSRMGACIKVEGNSAIIDGVKKLTGARVSAPDLRAGAALVIAGLAADGITVVDDIVYIQRGYENFEEKLRSLGAEIEKVSSEKEIQKFRLRVG